METIMSVNLSVDLDDEEFRVRSLQGIGTALPVAIVTIKPTVIGNTLSTMAPAVKATNCIQTTTRPTLASPSSASQDSIDKYVENTGKRRPAGQVSQGSQTQTGDKTTEAAQEHLNKIKADIERETEQLRKLQDDTRLLLGDARNIVNSMYELVKLQKEAERLADKSSEVFEKDVKKTTAEIEKEEAEKRRMLEEEAKKYIKRPVLDFVTHVAEYVMSFGSLVLGIAATAQAPAWAGGLLIASGLIGLANRFAHDSNLFQTTLTLFVESEETRRKITQKLEWGMFFLQTAVTFASVVYLNNISYFNPATADTFKKTVGFAITAAGIISTVFRGVVIPLHDSLQLSNEAKLKTIDNKVTYLQQTNN